MTVQYSEHLIDCRANHNQTYDDRQRIIRQDNPLIILHYSRSRPKVGMGRGGGQQFGPENRIGIPVPSSHSPVSDWREKQKDRQTGIRPLRHILQAFVFFIVLGCPGPDLPYIIHLLWWSKCLPASLISTDRLFFAAFTRVRVLVLQRSLLNSHAVSDRVITLDFLASAAA